MFLLKTDISLRDGLSLPTIDELALVLQFIIKDDSG